MNSLNWNGIYGIKGDRVYIYTVDIHGGNI